MRLWKRDSQKKRAEKSAIIGFLCRKTQNSVTNSEFYLATMYFIKQYFKNAIEHPPEYRKARKN